MPTPNRPKSQNQYSQQDVINSSLDEDFGVPVVEVAGYDGQNLQRGIADNLQIYHITNGGYDYFCFAAPGTALATAKWQIFRLDSDTNKMYADANANFDNVATDPTTLSYAYA